MKKIIFIAALLGTVNLASAQNTFPTAIDTKVGIGTITPAEQLEVTNPATGAIRISSQKTALQTNDVIGKLDFYKMDPSTGGVGVASSIQSRSYDLGGAFDMDFVTGSVATPVTAMTLHYNGRVGIGTNNPATLFHLNGINTITNSRGNIFVGTSDALAIDAGGQISFGGSYTATTQTYWAGIAGRKENGTDPDYSGYLQFITRKNGAGAAERMRITSEGNVGIGTVVPGLKTHINGISGFPATTGTAQTGVLRLQGLSSNAVLDFGVNGASGAFLQATNQTALDANYPLLLNPNGGNVGVGTKSPNAKLDIQLATSITPLTTSDEGLRLSISTTSTSNTTHVSSPFIKLIGGIWNGTVNSSRGFTQQVTGISGTNYGYRLAIGSTDIPDALSITGLNGNVSIGTIDTKGYKLAVNGSAVATSMTVKLNSAWPDYVFKEEYKLPTLISVKDYIDKNHHLPDMPSAAQIEKEGINLGEINTALTKKVEELTLYLIAQNKEMKELKERVLALEKHK